RAWVARDARHPPGADPPGRRSVPRRGAAARRAHRRDGVPSPVRRRRAPSERPGRPDRGLLRRGRPMEGVVIESASGRTGESWGDRALFAGLLLLLALAASLTPIRNYDFWWHLKTGELILEQGAVPRADPFSFTAGSAPWVDHEWLSQVLMHAGYVAVGPPGLVVLKAVLVCGLGLLMLRHLRREGHRP